MNNETNKKIIYFDNSSTTKISNEALEEVIRFSKDLYANPSSAHHFGFEVEEEIEKSKDEVANILKIDKSEMIFSSGATESNNHVFREVIKLKNREGKHIITTKKEHKSILSLCKELEKEGIEITYLNVDENGLIDLEELKKSIREDTILVSIMFVNNEIGSMENLYEIGNIIKEKNKKTLFHTDATQGFCKKNIDIKKSKIDFLSASAHKIHGPKGVGLLYIDKNIKLPAFIYGGGQQENRRSGTLYTPGIAGFLKTITQMSKNQNKNDKYLKELRDYLIDSLEKLNEKYDMIKINTKKNDFFSSNIISATFKNIRSEVLMRTLEEENIFVSAGSACSSKIKNSSDTLKAIGLNDNDIDSTIRFSFSIYNEKEEIDYLIKVLDDKLPILKKFIRK